MIAKRSPHMPMFTKMQRIQMIQLLSRTFLNQKNCGTQTLPQNIISHHTHQNGPKQRFRNVNASYGLFEYQAMKNSWAYENATIMPQPIITLHIAWMCSFLMMCCRLNR